MTGFIASPQPPASPPESQIDAGGFWPALDINHFRDSMRIGNQSIPDPRVREAVMGAIVIADDNLSTWRAQHEAAGIDALKDVPSRGLTQGETYLTLLWRRAVYAFAAADLIETHRDVAATPLGVKQADQQSLTPDDHRRNAIHAIRTIRGERRTSVELI